MQDSWEPRLDRLRRALFASAEAGEFGDAIRQHTNVCHRDAPLARREGGNPRQSADLSAARAACSPPRNCNVLFLHALDVRPGRVRIASVAPWVSQERDRQSIDAAPSMYYVSKLLTRRSTWPTFALACAGTETTHSLKETEMTIELGKATVETKGLVVGSQQDSLTKPRPIAVFNPA